MSLPLLQAGSSAQRQIRSERLAAIQAVLKVFFRHLDPVSRYIGLAAPDGSFISLDMKAITQETGLGQRRCERAITSLKHLGLIEVYPPKQLNLASACVKYSGSRAVRAITPAFGEYLLQIGFFDRPDWRDAPIPVICEDMD